MGDVASLALGASLRDTALLPAPTHSAANNSGSELFDALLMAATAGAIILFVSPLVTKASYDYLQVFSRPHMYSYLSLLWEGARMTSGARLQASYMSSHCLTVARQFLSIVLQGQVQRRLQQQVD